MSKYVVPHLMDGYQIAKRRLSVFNDHFHNGYAYYLQERDEQGRWQDIRGPYKQSNHAKEWLRRKRFRDILDARKRGDEIVYPPLLRDSHDRPL